jgi:hypothetical protein
MVTPSMLTCSQESRAPFAMIRDPPVEVENRLASLMRTPGVRAGDYLAQRRGLRVEQGSRRSDLHCLLHFADLQAEIQARLLVDLDYETTCPGSAEALRAHLDAVFTGNEVSNLILAVCPGLGCPPHAGCGLRDVYDDAGHNGATLIGDGSENSCIERLPAQWTGAGRE